MRDKTVCFTGHRKLPPEETNEIADRLKTTIRDLIDSGYCYFGVGGALGFDTLAAQTVLELKKRFPADKTDFGASLQESNKRLANRRHKNIRAHFKSCR